jgi:hypothetical protein
MLSLDRVGGPEIVIDDRVVLAWIGVALMHLAAIDAVLQQEMEPTRRISPRSRSNPDYQVVCGPSSVITVVN